MSSDKQRGQSIKKKLLETYGDKSGEEMARRARLGHQAQIEKYGGEAGYKAEMKRRRSKGHLKDAEEFTDLEQS